MLETAIVFLAATLIAVPLFKGLKLGAILGYLCAGVIIGPSVLSLVGDAETILHFAELGVVLMLFVIGLELEPKKLWQMRNKILVTGGMQLILSALIISLAIIAFSNTLSISAIIVIGLALALSSTAFAIQLMTEQNILRTEPGQQGFSVLLMQDVAVIPILLLTAALAPMQTGETQPWWIGAIAVIGVLVVGFYLINPFLQLIAKYGSNEVMTAAALFIVLVTAMIVYKAGLSMGMGAFIAGILLADSSFKHQLETEIEPFKGLLLGLFFIAVGMNINLDLLIRDPMFVVSAAIALMCVKALVIAVIIRISKQSWVDATRVAIMLSQGGEFAFVVMTLAVSGLLLSPDVAGMVNLVVGISMALTSPAIIFYSMWFNSRNCPSVIESNIQHDDPNVIVAGFGRFGQITARILSANNIHFTAIDIDASHIEFVKRFGNKVFYGDATRLDLLKKSGIDTCDVLLIAIDDKEAISRLATLMKEEYPHVKLVVRARDRMHATELAKLGIKHFVRETFHSGLQAATMVLELVGHSENSAKTMTETFANHDNEMLDVSINEEMGLDALIQHNVESRAALKDLFKNDQT